MFRGNVLIVGIMGFWCLGAAGPGEKAESEVNLRENCRRVVGGDYLTAYDEWESSKQLLLRLYDKVETLNKEIIKSEKALAAKKSKLQPAEYDTNKLKDVDDAQAKLDLLQNNLKEAAKAHQDAMAVGKKANERRNILTGHISRVFSIEKRPTMDKAYPWHVVYRHQCPKYRAQCALPEDQKTKLKALAELLSDPEPCRRYSQQTNK